MTNTNQQEQLYRWVNASERLCDTEAIYRCPDRDGLRSVFSLYLMDEEQASQFFSPFPLYTIEWLEPYTPPVEDGKLGGEVKTKEEIFKSKYLEEYFKLHNKDDEAANQSLVVTYKMNSILKRAILAAMEEYKSQPSTPVQDGNDKK